MDQLERRQDTRAGGLPGPTGGDAPTPDLTRYRQDGRRLLAAGQNAVANALSGQSEGFMRAMRQEGGQ